MNDSDSISTNFPGILKRKSQNLLTCRSGNQFDALHHTRDNNMFNPTILSFSVFSNQDRINVCVGGFIARDGATGTDVSEEGECSSESQVEGDMSFSDGRSEGTF